jgi:hypothetical protein
LKLIHCAVLKDHSGGIGMTGALKIVYGTLSMHRGARTSARTSACRVEPPNA